MITNKKRREVAQKLRTLACTPDEIGITEHAVIRDLGISAGIYDDSCRSEDVLIVADLIDRPTCKFKPAYEHDLTGEVSLVECTACAWTIEPWIAYEFRYCPMCGAEVIDEDIAN